MYPDLSRSLRWHPKLSGLVVTALLAVAFGVGLGWLGSRQSRYRTNIPTAPPAPVWHWSDWTLIQYEGSQATMDSGGRPQRLRLQITHPATNTKDAAQLIHWLKPAMGQRVVAVQFAARSETPCSLRVYFSRHRPAYDVLTEQHSLELGPAWRRYTVWWRPRDNEPHPAIVLAAGDKVAEIELDRLRILELDRLPGLDPPFWVAPGQIGSAAAPVAAPDR